MQIAHVEQVEPDTIAAYEALFFNVRDRLKRRAWIYTMVLDFDRDWTGQDVANVWAFFAYNANDVVLQALVDDFAASGKPDYQHLHCAWFTDFPPNYSKRFLWWSIQSLLLPRRLTQTQSFKMIELNQRLIGVHVTLL